MITTAFIIGMLLFVLRQSWRHTAPAPAPTIDYMPIECDVEENPYDCLFDDEPTVDAGEE